MFFRSGNEAMSREFERACWHARSELNHILSADDDRLARRQSMMLRGVLLPIELEVKSYVPVHCSEHEMLTGYCEQCEALNAEQGRDYCAAGDTGMAATVAQTIKEARRQELLARAMEANTRDADAMTEELDIERKNASVASIKKKKVGQKIRFADQNEMHPEGMLYRTPAEYWRPGPEYARGWYSDESGNGFVDTSFYNYASYDGLEAANDQEFVQDASEPYRMYDLDDILDDPF